MVFWFLVTKINVCSKSHSTIGQIYQNWSRFSRFWKGSRPIQQNHPWDFWMISARGIFYFLFFAKISQNRKKNPKRGFIWPQRRCRESKKGVWNSLDRKNLVSFSWKFDDFCIIPQNCEIPKVNCNIFWSREDAST